MPPAVLCKTQVNCRGETCSSIGKRKTKYACIVDADDSMTMRLEDVPQRYHEDHITAKGVNWLNHYNLVHKCISIPQTMKIPDAKAAVEKNDKKFEKIPAWQRTKVRNKKEVIDEARAKGRKQFILRHWWIFVLLRIRSWNHNFRNTKGRLYSEVTFWKMIQDHTQYLLNKDHQHCRWQPQKSWTLFQDNLDIQDKQQRQYPLVLRSEWKTHRRYFKNFQSQNVQISGYVYQEITWYFLFWTSWWRIHACHESRSWKVGSSDASSNALQNTLVLLKLTNLWESELKELFTDIMMTTLQEKAWIHWVTTILCTNVFLCLKQWKYQMQRQQWTRNGTCSRQSQHGIWKKSRAKGKLSWKHTETTGKSTLPH